MEGQTSRGVEMMTSLHINPSHVRAEGAIRVRVTDSSRLLNRVSEL